jgi:DNA-binding NarL/FixJ family response regulator
LSRQGCRRKNVDGGFSFPRIFLSKRGLSSIDLTAREQQVLELVEQGVKNKEIALELGIRSGTVKIHLKHIFEDTGVLERYWLAISGLRDKGVVSLVS